MKARAKLYEILDNTRTTALSVFVNVALMTLIFANIVAVIAESDPRIFAPREHWFGLFEFVSVIIFSVEYLARVWASAENPKYAGGWKGRLRYMISPMALVDLLAILPFYLGAFLAVDMRYLRALRLFRIFKLTRHFAAIDVLLTVIRKELATLASAVFVMAILVILASSGMYYVERNVQPQVFGTIPRSMWWAVVTLTTVGYGDVVPTTTIGKLFGVCVTILGVGMAALPAGIIASGFSHELQSRRDRYRLAVRNALSDDGTISSKERDALEERRANLGLTEADAKLVRRDEKTIQAHGAPQPNAPEAEAPARCPHCGKAL